MFVVKDYLTGEVVALCSEKADALAMVQSPRSAHDPVLILEEKFEPKGTK
jgi:hypothetical protein